MVNIYFIKNEEAIKIGRTKDLSKRIKNLQTSNHIKLEVLYIIENVEPSFEKHVHSICTLYHIKGEWFRPECLTFLMSHPWFKENMKKP